MSDPIDGPPSNCQELSRPAARDCEMKRNYQTVASFFAFVVALPLPFVIAMVFTEQVGDLGSRLGATVYLLIVLWVRAWTLIGFLTGLVALWRAFRGCGSRWLAGVAIGANTLLALMVKGPWFF